MWSSEVLTSTCSIRRAAYAAWCWGLLPVTSATYLVVCTSMPSNARRSTGAHMEYMISCWRTVKSPTFFVGCARGQPSVSQMMSLELALACITRWLHRRLELEPLAAGRGGRGGGCSHPFLCSSLSVCTGATQKAGRAGSRPPSVPADR